MESLEKYKLFLPVLSLTSVMCCTLLCSCICSLNLQSRGSSSFQNSSQTLLLTLFLYLFYTLAIQISECEELKIPIIYLKLCYYIYFLNVLCVHKTQVICVHIQSTDFISGWKQIKQCTTVTFLLDSEDLIE